MRVKVLQSAAIKILQQKLSRVSFPAGFPLRLEMIEVFFTYVFYLVILVILGLMALLVKLYSYGTTKNLEPDTRTASKQEMFLLALKDTPKDNRIEDEVAQKQNVAEINSELQDKKDTSTCFDPLTEKSSETKPGPGIPEQQPPSRPKVTTKAVLSPLTLFLLGTETKRTYDPVYEKRLQRKRRQWCNRALKRGRNPYANKKNK